MSTAITSSTSTSVPVALPGMSAKRGAARAAAASAKAAIAANSKLRCILGLRADGGRRGTPRLAPQRAVGKRAHEARQAQSGAHEGAPVVAPHPPAASPRAARALEFVIEREAERAVI